MPMQKEKSDTGRYHSPCQTSFGAPVALQQSRTLRMSKEHPLYYHLSVRWGRSNKYLLITQNILYTFAEISGLYKKNFLLVKVG